MKKYFAKYLPVKGEIKIGDKFIDTEVMNLVGTRTSEEGEYDFQKVKLFLCSIAIQVRDKVYPFLSGHCDHVEESPFHPEVEWRYEDYLSGWPNEPHTIVDLHHSDYKPYRIRTNHGYLSPGRGIKVIGEISPEAIWAKEGDKFDEDEIQIWSTSGVIEQKTKDNLDYKLHAKHGIIKVLNPSCKCFH